MIAKNRLTEQALKEIQDIISSLSTLSAAFSAHSSSSVHVIFRLFIADRFKSENRQKSCIKITAFLEKSHCEG